MNPLTGERPGGDVARSVLLVEDNPGDARLVAEMLDRTAFGTFAVTHVTTLAAAVGAVRAGRYGCVLLDLSLPDADELEGLTAIRAADAGLPVVVLTGADQSAAYAALRAGAQDFLVKGEADGGLVGRAVRYAVERGRVDAALLARGRELAQSHRLARMGTWEWRADTDEVVCSAELRDLLGLPDAAAPATGSASSAGAAAFQLVVPADRPAVRTALDAALRDGGRFAFEARVAGPAGLLSTRHVGEARRGPDGRLTLFATMQDVTAMERARAAERDSERRFRTIVETSQEGVWTVGPDEVTTFVNRRMAYLLGYEPEDMATRHLASFMDAEAWADALPVFEGTRRGEPMQRDLRLRRTDGATVHVIVSASALWADDGTYAGALLMATDITGRYGAEQQLRLDHDVAVGLTAARDLGDALAALVERAAAGVGSRYVEVWHRPMGGHRLELSPVHHAADDGFAGLRAVTSAVRLDPGEDVVGEVWLSREPRVGPWSQDRELAAAAAACGLRGAYVMPVVADDVVLAVVVWHLSAERPAPAARTALDNMGGRLNEFALRWQVEQMKNVFLTAVSHELRTPLTALIGHATTLHRHAADLGADVRAECVAGIVRNATKLNVMLCDLLDVDRLARGVIEPRRHLVRLDELVRTVAEGFDPDLVRTTLELSPCVGSVDPPKVERIVENLLANAGKYTPPGSRVTVRLTAEGPNLLIAVEDRGRGVADHLKARIFEPFQRGENVSPYAPGTGIGLSLVAGFARLHGGHAWVEDRAGGGASFRVGLPLAPGDGPVAGGSLPAQRLATRDETEQRWLPAP